MSIIMISFMTIVDLHTPFNKVIRHVAAGDIGEKCQASQRITTVSDLYTSTHPVDWQGHYVLEMSVGLCVCA